MTCSFCMEIVDFHPFVNVLQQRLTKSPKRSRVKEIYSRSFQKRTFCFEIPSDKQTQMKDQARVIWNFARWTRPLGWLQASRYPCAGAEASSARTQGDRGAKRGGVASSWSFCRRIQGNLPCIGRDGSCQHIGLDSSCQFHEYQFFIRKLVHPTGRPKLSW